MTDLERARQLLPGHSIALCRGEERLTDDARGIAPMMNLLAAGQDLHGFSVADLVVGRAAALLFVRAGIVAVYAATLSCGGRALEGIYAAFCDTPPPQGGWTALVSAETAALLGK